MKTYGEKRCESPGRTKRGTSRPCPCCCRVNPKDKTMQRVFRKRARQEARREIQGVV